MRHGSGSGSGRGRHKGANSPETRAWRDVAEKVDGWKPEPKRKPKDSGVDRSTPAPAKPAWLDQAEYEALVELRRGLR